MASRPSWVCSKMTFILIFQFLAFQFCLIRNWKMINKSSEFEIPSVDDFYFNMTAMSIRSHWIIRLRDSFPISYFYSFLLLEIDITISWGLSSSLRAECNNHRSTTYVFEVSFNWLLISILWYSWCRHHQRADKWRIYERSSARCFYRRWKGRRKQISVLFGPYRIHETQSQGQLVIDWYAVDGRNVSLVM